MDDVSVIVTPQVNEVLVEETGVTVDISTSPVVVEVTSAQGPPGPQGITGAQGPPGNQNMYIQTTQPSGSLPFLWVQDLGSGNYSVWMAQ